ncbi:MAG TPA: hypothetical protein VI282_00675 [Verrucomicrobiae bacterium]
MRWFRWALACLAIAVSCFGQTISPIILHSPTGEQLSLPPGVDSVWLYIPELRYAPAGITRKVSGKFVVDRLPKDIYGIYPGRVRINGSWSSIQPVVLDDLPVTTNVVFRASVAGSISEKPIQISFRGKKGLPYRFQVLANKLGSKLDPVLRIIDEHGKEIATRDDGVFDGRDCRLEFNPPRTGMYVAELRDVANGSGSDYFFCLRSDIQQPYFEWARHDEVGLLNWLFEPTIYILAMSEPSLPHDSAARPAKLRVPIQIHGTFVRAGEEDWYEFEVLEKATIIISARTREAGSPCDAAIALYDAKQKLIVESAGTGFEGASMTNKLERGKYMLRVREISRLGGAGFDYWLAIEQPKPGVALSADLERVSFSKEGEAKIKIVCKRFDFDGEVKLEVDGLPAGVSVMDDVIPKGKNEVELKLKRVKEVESFQIRINGSIEGKETEGNKFPVSTMPALRKLYPLQMFPCAAMDGWIAVNPAAP